MNFTAFVLAIFAALLALVGGMSTVPKAELKGNADHAGCQGFGGPGGPPPPPPSNSTG